MLQLKILNKNNTEDLGVGRQMWDCGALDKRSGNKYPSTRDNCGGKITQRHNHLGDEAMKTKAVGG